MAATHFKGPIYSNGLVVPTLSEDGTSLVSGDRNVLMATVPQVYDQFNSATKLQVIGGRVFRGQQAYRGIGINAWDLFYDYLKAGTAYTTDLTTIASYGIKTIRVSATPNVAADITTYIGATGGAPTASANLLYIGSAADGLSNNAVDVADVIIVKGGSAILKSQQVADYLRSGTIPTGAVMRLKLDGNANDSIGGYNGTLGSAGAYVATGL